MRRRDVGAKADTFRPVGWMDPIPEGPGLVILIPDLDGPETVAEWRREMRGTGVEGLLDAEPTDG